MLCFEILWNRKLLFLVPAIFLWCAYIGFRIVSAPDLLRKWGFRTDNLKYAAKVNGIVWLGTLSYYWVLERNPMKELLS